jgi:tRNA A37 threonylcarbamoyladenosine dehydratase
MVTATCGFAAAAEVLNLIANQQSSPQIHQ